MSRSATGQFKWFETAEQASGTVSLAPTLDSYGDRLAAQRALDAIERREATRCSVCGRCREICAHGGAQ